MIDILASAEAGVRPGPGTCPVCGEIRRCIGYKIRDNPRALVPASYECPNGHDPKGDPAEQLSEDEIAAFFAGAVWADDETDEDEDDGDPGWCNDCGEDYSNESHYHCSQCRKVCSMMGHLDPKTGEYTCKAAEAS